MKVIGFSDEGRQSEFECEDYAATPLDAAPHKHWMVVLNPNAKEPSKSKRLDVRDGHRNPTDPLRFERVEIYNDDGALIWAKRSDGIEVKTASKSTLTDVIKGLKTAPTGDV